MRRSVRFRFGAVRRAAAAAPSAALASSSWSCRQASRWWPGGRPAGQAACGPSVGRGKFSSSSKEVVPRAFRPPVLEGRCRCGKCGWRAVGDSSMNFLCHCSVCRAAAARAARASADSGGPTLPGAEFGAKLLEQVPERGMAASAFQRHQVSLIGGESMSAEVPEGSKNTRYFCGDCKDYVAEDATAVLGVWALPHSAVAICEQREGPENDGARSLRRLSASDVLPPLYRPNHRIFFESRADSCDAEVVDQIDSLPRWETLPEGKLSQADQKSARRRAKRHREVDTSNPSLGSGVVHDRVTGRVTKDVLPLSPARPPYAEKYHFTVADPIANHETAVSQEKMKERVAQKYDLPDPALFVAPKRRKRDVIVVGGGHNGLVSAAYLARAGLDVCVLERRHLIGGAAVTEELYPGFKYSRASYLAGLLRPVIVNELGLENHGFKYLVRDPSSFTPTICHGPRAGPDAGKYLMLGSNDEKNRASISQFSERDADAYEDYERFLHKIREMITPLLDHPVPDVAALGVDTAARERREQIQLLYQLMRVGAKNRSILSSAYELFTGPASKILDRWFEGEILKTTLATDAVVGAMNSPKDIGSAYVLLHHVMGSAAGKEGVWAFVEGGMGSVSNSLAAVARDAGAEILTNAAVDQITWDRPAGESEARATGVRMSDGSILESSIVLSNATPFHTFLELLPGVSRESGNVAEESPLPVSFVRDIRHVDYSCGALKINCAVSELPNFDCAPNAPGNLTPGPQHRGTVHFENRMEELEFAHREASMGIPATRPAIEMTIPSSLDPTLAPDGKFVVQLFVQYAPYDVDPKIGSWADPGFKEAFADRVFAIVDEFAPNFSSSVLARDILSPLDLERIFGLQKGSITHGSLAIHQLFHARPAPGYARHRTPVKGLYLCGSGAHPGGGVMGAPGRNAASVVLYDRKKFF